MVKTETNSIHLTAFIYQPVAAPHQAFLSISSEVPLVKKSSFPRGKPRTQKLFDNTIQRSTQLRKLRVAKLATPTEAVQNCWLAPFNLRHPLSQPVRAASSPKGGAKAAEPPTGAMCKMFRPVVVYRLGTATGLFIIHGVQVRRQRGIQSITACRSSPGLGDRRSAPHRPSCGCAVPHRKVWQAYCRLHLEADMHRFLAIFALSIR